MIPTDTALATLEGLRWKWWRRLRLIIGTRIIGGELLGVWTRLWLIREAAMKAVNADGRVTLAECDALARILYEPTPGTWTLTVTRNPERSAE